MEPIDRAHFDEMEGTRPDASDGPRAVRPSGAVYLAPVIGRLSLPLAVASASIAAALATPACHKEAVIPFPDTGSPCAASTTTMKIDCSEFPQTTCAVPSTTCVQTSYGCRDGGYFEQTDDSLCATDAARRRTSA